MHGTQDSPKKSFGDLANARVMQAAHLWSLSILYALFIIPFFFSFFFGSYIPILSKSFSVTLPTPEIFRTCRSRMNRTTASRMNSIMYTPFGFFMSVHIYDNRRCYVNRSFQKKYFCANMPSPPSGWDRFQSNMSIVSIWKTKPKSHFSFSIRTCARAAACVACLWACIKWT